jgi:alkylation response protein AidB-like acyl-CoA dehydrogenase
VVKAQVTGRFVYTAAGSQIYEGTNQVQCIVMARQLLKGLG